MKKTKKRWFKISLAVFLVLAIAELLFNKKSPCAVHIGEYRDDDW